MVDVLHLPRLLLHIKDTRLLPRSFKIGDLVQVFHGTGAYVEGRKTVAYIGRIVGYNEALGKWEVDFEPLSELKR